MDIPVSAAEQIAHKYGYDQVIVIARCIGANEHVTTYGKDKANCNIAARIGDFLKYQVMGWPKEDKDKATTEKLIAELAAFMTRQRFGNRDAQGILGIVLKHLSPKGE
jgi:hypothetical protein